MRRGRHALVLVFALVAIVAATASADPPSPDNPAGNPFGDILGVVPAQDNAAAQAATRTAKAGNDLSYHQGPVMRTNRTYAIYWVPPGYSVSANYQSVIDEFLANVASDSGKSSNVYYSATQYSDTSGSISYSSSRGGSYLDTTPFPKSGCSDAYTSICLTDSQLQAEIANAIATNGWQRGPTSLFFIFTPKDVGSCVGSYCAFSYYCAYHSSFGSGANVTLYANQPYAAWAPSACGSGQSPNGDDADSTINVASHEHNEAITDPLGNAWYDRRGYENGDKCAWNFGTTLGSTSSGRYNQVIGSGKYYLQQEWSNRSSGCVLTGV